MSRRHHGRPRQHDRSQPGAPTATGQPETRAAETRAPETERPTTPAPPTASPVPVAPESPVASSALPPVPPVAMPPAEPPHPAEDLDPAEPLHPAALPPAGLPPAAPPAAGPPQAGLPPRSPQVGQLTPSQATAPQLRRFIKSRPYVPMHELRRRFAIDGGDDDVTPVHIDRHWIFVGLPAREGGLLGELLRAGEIGYELSLDPRSPIVVGVYPMRPAPRP